MREYVEPVYGWDAFLQHTYHVEWFDPDGLSIIEDEDGKAIGVLEVIDEGDHLYLSRIELLPEAQGRGIGTRVVGDLLGQGRTVRLHVFTNNVGARRFYERLGFTADRHVDRDRRLSMLHPKRDTDAV